MVVVVLAPPVPVCVGAPVSPSPTTVTAVTVLGDPLGKVVVLKKVRVDRVVGPATPPPVPVARGLVPVGDAGVLLPEGDGPVFVLPCPGRTVVEVKNDAVPDGVAKVPSAGAVVSVSAVWTGDSAAVVSVAPGLVPPGVMGGKGRMLTSPVASSVGVDVSPAGVSSVGVVVVSAGVVSAGGVSPVGVVSVGGGFSAGVVSVGDGVSTVVEDSAAGGEGPSAGVDSAGGWGVPAGDVSVGGDCGDGDSAAGVLLSGLVSTGGGGGGATVGVGSVI